LDLKQFLANNNKLLSTVPEELYANTDLTILRLDSNQITGTISSRVGDLVELTDLFLSNNMFGGTLPVTILRLTSMGAYRSGFDFVLAALC
jgi:hypothetical protein